MAVTTHTNSISRPETMFLGLAPFLRMSIAGEDFRPIGQELLARAQLDPDDANLWMNLATVMQCLGQRELGLAIQAQALAMRRIYHLAAARQPARLRLLMLVVPGDLAANAPLDCLLEDGDIDLDLYYLDPEAPLALPVPEHDALIVGISASDDSREALVSLEQALADWPKPIINAPQHVATTERNAASALLQNAPGLVIPSTWRASRAALQDLAMGNARLPALFDGCDFPIILRPVGSHAGRDLERIESGDEILPYLSRAQGSEFFLSRFFDYRGRDGLFRKFRVALIDGRPYACHMAVSSNWMVHYVNADMYEDAQKRSEEAAFMEHFGDFAQRHRQALDAVFQRTQLDYVCIDCAETADGRLLVFEIEHAMVVHAMDPEDLFPYKQPHMRKVKNAFRDLLLRRTAGVNTASTTTAR